ncbi:MAG: T9SS type A sorting domain-containing protein [Bacteroidia bacterium]|nr:T9SS type A sorting domain-containing protein [Bacteroidia bacterium]
MKKHGYLALLGCSLVWAQLNGTYTIGPGGNYPTVTDAIAALNSQGISGNVVFEILSNYTGEGSYTSPLIVNPYPGMNNHTVTLTVASDRTTIAEISLDPSPTPSERFVLRLNGIRNFIVDGGPNRLIRFKVGTAATGLGVIGLIPTASNPCQNVRIQNIEVDGGSKDLTRVGVYLGGASTFPGAAPTGGNNNNIIEGCWVYRVQEGIILYGASATNRDVNNAIRRCKIGHPNLVRSWGGGGNYRSGIVAAHQDGLTIERDTIFNAQSDTYYGFTGILLGAAPGASTSPTAEPCVNTHIARNWIHTIEYQGTGEWDANGIRVYIGNLTGANIYIYNNFIAGILADGWSSPAGTWNAYGIILRGSSANAGIYVYHNSIHMYGVPPTTSPPTTSTPSCLAISSGITGGVYVRNNIFQNTQTPAGSPTANRTTVAIAYGGSSGSVFAELDNNAYYVSNANGSGYAFVGALGTTRYATLTAWRSAVGGGREQNSIQLSNALPFLSNTDLHLPLSAAELPLEGGGAVITTPVNINIDIDGEARGTGTPSASDIGADEMPVPPCPSSISAGSISISPASVTAGIQAFTITASGTVTHPAEWQISINGGPWTTLQPYSSSSITYTPSQAGTYDFRIVARVARYHQTCPGLQNDTSNVANGTATCPSSLNVGSISAATTSQPANTPFTITVSGTVSLPAQWQDSSASGGWNVIASYSGPTFTYTPTAPGTYYIRLAALPPSGCSGSPAYSNVVVLTATATGNTILDPLDITPRDPNRTDTTVNGNNLAPFTNTYTGPGNQSSADVFYMYILRACLDSIRVSTCNSTSFGSGNDLYLHVIHRPTGRTLYTDGGRCGSSNTIWQAALDIYHDPSASGASAVYSPYRGGMRLAAGDTLIIVVEGYSSATGPFVLNVQEFRFDPGSLPTLPSPPFFAYDTSRVCWRGAVTRDTLNTGITNPAITHVWYLNGTQISGVTGPQYVALINSPGVNTVVVELRSANLSLCAPTTSVPRDTVYILADSLPVVDDILVNGSPYPHGSFVEIEDTGTVCIQYQPSPVLSGYTYTWVINDVIYTGSGPHQECYVPGQTADTVILISQNGTCQKVDTIYLTLILHTPTTKILSGSSGTLRVYPNPAHDMLQIRSEFSGQAEVRLYDLRGQLLLLERCALRSKEPHNMKLPALPTGIYLIEVQQGERFLRERLMIE